MITEIRETAFAKLNICLDITGKMDDGYHSVKSIMQSVTLGDQITIIPKDSGGYFAKSNIKYLPTGEKNIAVRACRLFKQETGEGPDNAFIKIVKRIPVCGGLGGGSTDGAAVLRALNREYRVGLTRTELEAMGAKLGSDVPFCIAGGTVLAEGRGEVLTRIDPMPNCPVVICKPEFSSSTPELFAAIDKLKFRARPDTEGILAAISAGDLKEIARRMFNVFEYALANNRSLMVSELKSRLLDLGALGAAMSGTGSAVYALFYEAETAKKAAMTLKNEGHVSIYTQTMNEIEI
ncbi:MAG: 4-(cytidine 5'-diphospho)-2-C-methyl-D-erythritol kinase [Clostridiales bacterium]|nr:4-(cytidine 5'-diphospho)-2-C-methyl-D-erythritol kinase [Clostridiales bacterium]